MNKRGSVSSFVAATVPIALIAGIFAIDAGRIWLARARLQSALDAAALTAARDMDSPSRDANARAVLAGNYNGGAPPHPGQTATGWQNATITPSADNTQVTVQAAVDVKPLMSKILGIDLPVFAYQTQNIVRSATAKRTNTGLELALVFDITLSMVQSDGTDGGNNRVESARDAALTMLATLYGDDPDKPADNKKWLQDLFVSVVPFNVTVNYGPANTHFLTAAPPASDYPASWSGPTSWGGCAEMRSLSLLDATPQGSTTGLRRYYWPSTYKATEKYDPSKTNSSSSQPYCLSEASYRDTRGGNPSGAQYACMGHNDWTAPAYVLGGTGATGTSERRNTLIAAFASNSLVTAAGLNAWATAHGPNMMCPTQQVLPLTRDRATVEARIKSLANLPFSYGTNIAAGLQAGWFTLSPNWRAGGGFAGWPSAEPASTPDTRPPLPSLPLDYYAENMRKVMIVLTDGDNLWLSARDLQSGNALVRPESRRTEGFYGSYGYLGSDFAGDDRFTATSTSNGSGKIDIEAQAWCDKIKAKLSTNTAEKITIYTIGFGGSISSAATTVLTNCASVGQDGRRLYYPAPTAAELKKIFTTIGNNLARLRLSQ